MSVLSNSMLLCKLSDGTMAVYEVQPQHLNLQHCGQDLNSIAITYGREVARQSGEKWLHVVNGRQEEITDLRTIALLERCPLVDENLSSLSFTVLAIDERSGRFLSEAVTASDGMNAFFQFANRHPEADLSLVASVPGQLREEGKDHEFPGEGVVCLDTALTQPEVFNACKGLSKPFTVVAYHEGNRQIVCHQTEAIDGLQAFYAVAMENPGKDLCFVVALPGLRVEQNNIEFPGTALVGVETVLEQPEVFGVQESKRSARVR